MLFRSMTMIMGKANQSINVDKYGLLISLRWVKEFALHNPWR